MKKEKHLSALVFAFLVNACFFNSLQAQELETKHRDTIVPAAPSIAPAPEDRDVIFEKSEVAASVDKMEWRKHLEKHLVPVIQNAAAAGIKVGKYEIYVRFIVEKNGSISDVKALNDVGYGLALGAINVVRTGPKWKPAEQNNRKVRSYHTQPITFVISEK